MSQITRRVALQGIGAASLLPLIPLDLAEPKEEPTMWEGFHMPAVNKDFLLTAYNGYRPVLSVKEHVDLAERLLALPSVDPQRDVIQTFIDIVIDDGLLNFSISSDFFSSPLEVLDRGKLKYRVSVHDPADRAERLSFCNKEPSAVPYIILSRMWKNYLNQPARLLIMRNGAMVPKNWQLMSKIP